MSGLTTSTSTGTPLRALMIPPSSQPPIRQSMFRCGDNVQPTNRGFDSSVTAARSGTRSSSRVNWHGPPRRELNRQRHLTLVGIAPAEAKQCAHADEPQRMQFRPLHSRIYYRTKMFTNGWFHRCFSP